MANAHDSSLHDLAKAIAKLGVHDHLCLIYDTQEEQFAAVIPYIKLGLERNEKCLYVVDDNTAAMVVKMLQAAGIEVEAAVRSGQLTIANKEDVYLEQGYFDPDRMIGVLEQAMDEAKAAGFSALRIAGEMTWALGGDTGSERLLEYEAKLHYFFPAKDALAICQYNRNRFSPEIIKNVLSTHPLVIYAGRVCRNFYYVPPTEFLGEEQSGKEIDRLLANITSRAKVEEDLQRHQERLEELIRARAVEAEKAIHEQQQVFRTLVESSPDIIARYDRDCKRTYVNPTYLKVAQIPSLELISTAPVQRSPLPTASAAILQNLLRRVLDSGIAEAVDVIWPKAGQGDTWYNIYAFPELDREGRVASVMTVSRDITGRMQAEKDLREQGDHSQSLLRLSRKLERAQTYDEVLNAARDEVRTVIGYENLWAYLFTLDRQYAKALFAQGPLAGAVMSEEGTATLTIRGDRMLEEIAKANDIVVVEDARIDERTDKRLVAMLGLRTIVNVPVFLMDKRLGSVGTGTVGEEGVRVPSKSERNYLTALASHMAVTLDRIQLLERRRQAEEELSRMNERFALAASAARFGVWDWDIRKNELVWDDMMYALYGMRKEDFKGAYEAWLQGVHPDDRERSNEISKRAQRGEQEYDTEFRVVWPDNSIHWLKAYGRIIRDAHNGPVRMTGINFDITERKNAEESQRRSEEKYRRLIETVQEGIWVIDKESITSFVNPRLAEMLGYAPAEMLGKPLFAFMDEQGKRIAEYNVERRKQGIKEQHDFEFIRKDGGRIHARLETGPILDEAGQYAGAIAAVADITERRKAEETLIEREQHAQSLLRLSKRLERAQTYDEVLNAARDEVTATMGYRNLWVYLLAEDMQQAKVLIAKGPNVDAMMSNGDAATLTIRGDRMLEEIVEAKEIVIVEDARIDERTDKKIVAMLGNRTIVNVPIFLMDKRLGSVGMGTFGDEGVRVPTRTELEYLAALASHMAVTLEWIQLLIRRNQAEEDLRKLNEELEQRVQQRTAELERRNYELEQMNKAFVGRELKMVELKERIKKLEERNA